MTVVGLTGGIGSGKSTVAAGFAARGAVVVDADLVGRALVEPGLPLYREVVARFGQGIVAPGGGIDRPALAAIVFRDAVARHDLEAITHPAIREAMARETVERAVPGSVVVLDVPLLSQPWESMAGLIVVDAPVEAAVDRLVRRRGFAVDDARRRVAAQISRPERRAIADLVLDNDADLAHLADEVDRAWAWIMSLGRVAGARGCAGETTPRVSDSIRDQPAERPR